jgi:hypothetical protein
MADENPNSNGAHLASLQKLLDDRTKAVRSMGGKLRDWKKLAAETEEQRTIAIRERDEARAAVEQAKRDLDPSGYKAEVERLKGELRDREHRAVFDRLAIERGAEPEAVESIYRLSGYRAQADAPDEAAMGALLDGLRDSPGPGRLFGTAGAGRPSHSPPAGAGQGGRAAPQSRYRVTSEQLRDGAWCMEHAAEMRAARANGTFEIVD